MEYQDFIRSKETSVQQSGFESDKSTYNKNLFEWQKDIVHWALKKGKACLFEDCGLGKTLQQLSFADEVFKHTGGNVLILAPLAVAAQTKAEGEKFGIEVNICRKQCDVKAGINITNYEMIEHFEPETFQGIILDESSILKNSTGATKTALTEMFKNTPYKLCCTATPAPNDFMEIGNHAEFLGIMSQTEMLATYFVHDGKNTSKWRLKGHAKAKFFEWIASWACCMTSPANLGYDSGEYKLPPLIIHEIQVESGNTQAEDGQLMFYAETAESLSERREARKESLEKRVEKSKEIAESVDGQALIWCDYNDESALLAAEIAESVEVKGADTDEHKKTAMLNFSNGEVKRLISKPKIAGWGMNWQNCNTVIFCGLSDSFESYYQAVRRCWRFGQKKPVDVYIITSEAEIAVKQNIERKQSEAQQMTGELVKYTKDILESEIKGTVRISERYIAIEQMIVPEWLRSEVV
ncbi:MAG: DEAD/DEAH box helicase [Clostridiales bacterium]|nr:DEAD/DEAH box helicase [Clostridiales bacterium]